MLPSPSHDRFLLVGAALLLAYAAACGGSSGSEPDDGNGGSAANDDVPAGLSLILFRDTTRNSIVAQSIADGRRWELPSVPEKFVVAIDCSRDGGRAAYLKAKLGTTSVTLSDGDSLITLPGQATGLAWSPHGGRIAVTVFDPPSSRNQLLLLDLESGAQTTAASGSGVIGAPRWSPDGARIAFDTAAGTSNQLLIYTLGDSAAAKLADRPQPAFGPDWYPDGAALLFSAPTAATGSQIFTIGADGANERQLTSTEVSKGLPRWSPDGSLVAYAGTIVVPTVSRLPVLRHNLAVWTMNPDGSAERQLTDLQQDAVLLGWCVSGPWLAEGWRPVQ